MANYNPTGYSMEGDPAMCAMPVKGGNPEANKTYRAKETSTSDRSTATAVNGRNGAKSKGDGGMKPGKKGGY